MIKNKWLPWAYVTLFFVALAMVVFRCAWGADQVFSGSDCNIGLIANVHRQLPDLFRGAYRAGPVLGHAGVTPFSFYNLGRWLLSPFAFSNAWYGVCLLGSSLFLIAYLRLWGLRWTSTVAGALCAFWVGSVTLCSAGHLNKLGVMMFFTLALWLVEKAVRCSSWKGRVLFASGAGLATGFMLLEQQDVALLAGLFLGAYTLFRIGQTQLNKGSVWAGILVPVALISLLMAAPTASTAYRQNVTETGMKSHPQQQWEFITQWSMVPSELADLIAPGYTGWSTGNPAGPYWGTIGQSAEWSQTGQGFRNFRLDSLYIGVVPILLAFFAVFAAVCLRKKEAQRSGMIVCWAILAVIALVLSFGKFSPLYKWFYSLPLVGNIRAPIKLLHNFQVMIGILSAYGLDQLLNRNRNWKACCVSCAGLAAVFGILAIGVSVTDFSEWETYAPVLAENSTRAWLHSAGIVTLFAALFAGLWRKPQAVKPYYLAVLLMAVLAVDSVFLTTHYFKSESVVQLKQGNPLLNYLQEQQGDDRIFFLDQGGVYNRWLALETGYYGLNVFNIWQMPRMPQEYKTFLAAAGKNQVRLWQLASVKYITAPASVLRQLNGPLKQQLNPVMFYRFEQQGDQIAVNRIERVEQAQDQVLLEFNAYVPRFALFSQWKALPLDQQCAELFSATFDPRKKVLVDSASGVSDQPGSRAFQSVEATVTLSDATVHTQADQSGVLLFTQRYQPRWKVSVDGTPAQIILCNYLSMGVQVPAGSHTVRFYCN